jgi:lipopolysaccharide transport system ATP-binding protein
MSEDRVISVQNVSKAYRIWSDPSQRLISPLLNETARVLPGALGRGLRQRAAKGYRDFYALQDVSFELARGEAVGIIGRNGAGKSTLLQIIAGTLQPSSGQVTVRGRVAALLELGAGFNVDFTGRENVHLSGAVLGLSRAEMDERFEAITQFADIGDFIDQPVKTYSSGMMMRLAFAVNTCVDPDILIVDEALSVGDAPFQAKCFRRLRQLIEKGVSLLFVSHDLGTVRTICSRALWLKNGRAEKWGAAKEVAKEYEKFCWQEQGVQLGLGVQEQSAAIRDVEPPASTEQGAQSAGHPALFVPNPAFDSARKRTGYGTGEVVINNLLITGTDNTPTLTYNYNAPITIHVLIEVKKAVASEFMATFLLRDLKGNAILAAQDVMNRTRIEAEPGARYALSVSLSLPLHHQKYVLHAAIFGFKDGQTLPQGRYDFGNAVLWEVIDEAAIVEVLPCSVMPLSGPVHMDTPVKLTALGHRQP